MAVRVALQEILEGALRFSTVVQVVLVNLANREQRIDTILAAGILLAQELVLLDCRSENRVVFESPSYLDLQFGNCDHAGIGFGRGRRPEIYSPVSVDHALILLTGPLLRRAAIQRFAHALGGVELAARPGVGLAHASMGWHDRQQRDQQSGRDSPQAVA